MHGIRDKVEGKRKRKCYKGEQFTVIDYFHQEYSIEQQEQIGMEMTEKRATTTAVGITKSEYSSVFYFFSLCR